MRRPHEFTTRRRSRRRAGRELFARVGVPHPLGVERIAGAGDAIAAIAALRARRPGIAQIVVKLDESAAGRGNAVVDLGGLPAPGAPDELVRIDFVVARNRRGRWRPYAIELNLRKGGTTHPFMTASLLTGGGCRHYVASDHLPIDGLCGEDAIARLADHGLRFDPKRGSGVLLHMLGAAVPLGRIGATALAPTATEARALYDRAAALLSDPARRALA